MSCICIYCDFVFKRSFNLIRHLKDDKCLKFSSMTALDIYEKIQNKKNTLKKNWLYVKGISANNPD